MSNKSVTSNFLNEDLNPCIKETELSRKCLEEKLYHYDKCTTYFLNYKNCKAFWRLVAFKRRKAGISPNLPNKEERNKILKLRDEGIEVISVN